jgi:transcriptional regulator with XRE-family HTH domain
MAPEAQQTKAKMAFSRELGITLQRLRRASGMSQEDLAHRAGMSSYTYYKLEKGESQPGTPSNPRLFTIIAIAQVLGVPVDQLLPRSQPDLTTR